jgi:hypothetical protein
MKKIDTIEKFEFKSLSGFYGCCKLEVYKDDDVDGPYPVVIVMTELPDNPGTSVTNAVEIIARKVCKEYSMNPLFVTFIEHYPQRGL